MKVKSLQQMPGPSPIFPIGNALDFIGSQPHEVFLRYAQAYGGISAFWLFGLPNILISNPDLLETVLVTNRHDYYKDTPRSAFAPILRRDLFITNGEDDWRRKRQEHPFSQADRDQHLSQLLPDLQAVIQNHLEHLTQSGRPIDLWETFLAMFYKVWVCGILGHPSEDPDFGDYQRIMNTISRRVIVALSLNPLFWFSVRRWHGYFAHRVQQGADHPTEIDILCRHLQGQPDLSFDEQVDQTLSIFIAGVHPTATTLFSAFYLLCHHPQVQQTLRQEVQAFSRQYKDGFSLEDLNALPYLDRVLNETLRLYSTVPLSQRVVLPNRSVRLDEYDIPEGIPVWFSSWAIHRNPKYWSEPLKFDPDRFTKAPPPNHFFPFGIGPRECVGKPWALMTAKLALVTILSHYQVEVDPKYDYRTKLGPALFVPKGHPQAQIRKLQ